MKVKTLINMLSKKDEKLKITGCYISPYSDKLEIFLSDDSSVSVLYGRAMSENRSLLYGGRRGKHNRKVAKK